MEGKNEIGPRLVQELAMNDRDVPSCYIQSDNDNDRQLNAPHPQQPSSPSSVPVIDLDHLSRSDGADEVAFKFRSALQSWGLFLVRTVPVTSWMNMNLS